MAQDHKVNFSLIKNIKNIKLTRTLATFGMFVKNLYKRKVLFFTIIGVLVFVIAIGVFVLRAKMQAKIQVKEEEAAQAVAINLSIHIPPGAYPKGKTFTIEPVMGSDLKYYEQVYRFVGNIYNVKPDDGRDEFAIKPLQLKMYIPGDRLLGRNYANLTLAYMKDESPPNPFPGSYIGKDERGYFVAASAFHASKIGVIPVPVTGEQRHGLRLVRDVLSVKPGIIIVPGESPKFSGDTSEGNFWETVFPDRPLYVFDYPLSQPRSMLYMQEASSFFKSIGDKSFVKFESEIFAQELKRPDVSKNEYHIIAQGIGGLIVLYTLLNHPEITNIKKVILIGVPYRGTNIANTLIFANMIYSSPVKSAAEVLGLSEKTFMNIRFHIFNYIEMINDYYEDVLPDSDVVRNITSKPLREDLKYLVIVGTLPPFGIDVKGSGLERIYPELVSGRGDGVVSDDEARLPGVPLVTFPVSFDSYYSKSEIMNTIKGFIDTDKLPTPPKLEEDKYKEYLPVDVVKREGLPPKAESEQKTESYEATEEEVHEGYYQPKQFVEEEILLEEVEYSIKGSFYNSGGCVRDEPYFATNKVLYKAKNIIEKGNFKFLKEFPSALSGIKDKEKVVIDVIGFRSLGSVEDMNDDSIDDLLVFPDGTLYYTEVSGEVSVKLYISTKDGKKLVVKSPGTYSKLIPVDENSMIFLTDKMLILVSKDGQVLDRVVLSLITRSGYATNVTYALKIDDAYFIITKEHYMIVYDYKKRESWLLGEGWIGSKKILYYKPSNLAIVVGKKFLNFVDLNSKRLLQYIQPLEYYVKDAFVCSGKLYVIEEKDDGFVVHIYPIRI
ncbi:MAG: hypothetical protein J7L34_05250 [Thermotogaceae bacterium]|nr:hypothetical protein [Thermotogaceae bacterium]